MSVGPSRRVAARFLVDGLRRAQHRVRIGKRLRQIVDERQVRIADPHDVARLQLIVGLNPLAVDERAVAAIEVAQRPLALRLEHLGMIAAAALVLDDDGIGRRAADRHRLAVDQAEDVGPLRAFANNQVCRHRIAGRTSRSKEPAHERGPCARTARDRGSLLRGPGRRPSRIMPTDSALLTTYSRAGVCDSSRIAQNRQVDQEFTANSSVTADRSAGGIAFTRSLQTVCTVWATVLGDDRRAWHRWRKLLKPNALATIVTDRSGHGGQATCPAARRSTRVARRATGGKFMPWVPHVNSIGRRLADRGAVCWRRSIVCATSARGPVLPRRRGRRREGRCRRRRLESGSRAS